MDPDRGYQIIRAMSPCEMFKYAIDLRSITQGRGEFEMEFDHYEEVPANQVEAIIAESKADE